MSSDSDIALTFNAMKQAKKERNAKRLDNADPIGWEQKTTHHWVRKIDGYTLSYWPSTGLCMYKNKRMNINGKRVKALLEKGE